MFIWFGYGLDHLPLKKLLKFLICELPTIIGDNIIRNIIVGDDSFPYKLLDILSCDCGQGFNLNSLCEVIHRYKQEFALSFCKQEGSEHAHSPYCKGSWRDYFVQLVGWLVY